MIVDQVALLIRQLQLSDEASNSQLLDDLQDIELLVKSRARLCLKLVLVVIRVATAQAPRARKVLFAEEAPHVVAEGLAAIAALSAQVMLELLAMLRWLWIMVTILVFGLLNIVVEFLGHGVVQGETLVGSQHISDET